MAGSFASLTDCKTRLRITDTLSDDELRGIMAAATDALIDVMNRDPRVNDYADTLNGTGVDALPVRHYPIQAVASVTVAGTALDLDQFAWDDYTVRRLHGAFPRGFRNVVVAYTAGLDPTPRSLKEAYLITVKAMWMARAVNPNSTGESWAGVSSEAWYPTGAGAVPPAARSLVNSLTETIVVP